MSNELEQQANNEVEANEEIPSMEDLFAESMEVKIGDTVKGEVLTIDDDKQVIVGIEGAGVEGVIPYNEISATPFDEITDVLNVGDVVELVVIKQIKEKENGSFLLSKRRVEAKKVWAELEKKADNNETITVPVTRVVKGGLVVGYKKNKKAEEIYFVDDNIHSLTVGATRSGKTRSVVLQTIGNLALAGESMILSDPKRRTV